MKMVGMPRRITSIIILIVLITILALFMYQDLGNHDTKSNITKELRQIVFGYRCPVDEWRISESNWTDSKSGKVTAFGAVITVDGKRKLVYFNQEERLFQNMDMGE